MSTPILWIVIPGVASVGLFLMQKWQKTTVLLGTLLAVILAWLAWKIPIGEPILIGPLTLQVSDTLSLLGRHFILGNTDRPVLEFIYLLAAFWFAGSYLAHAGRLFIPAGFGIVALMTAALAVEPFLYAALLIEMAALMCVPILSAPGKTAGRGVLRFLIFQTIGTPFILFTGWMLAGIESNPANSNLVLQTTLMMVLGFSFLLAVFPFHTWIPMLAEESHPYHASFVFFMLPGMVSLLALSFLDRYTWLRSSNTIFTLLQLAGILMVIGGGLWAAFQTNLGRLLAYAVLVDIGLSFLALGSSQGSIANLNQSDVMNNPASFLFYALFVSRGLILAVWALALSTIRSKLPDLNYRTVQGIGRQMPLAVGALILANLAMAGFPLLVSFPARLALWEALAQSAPFAALCALFGSIGLMAGGFRALAILVMGPESKPWQITETLALRLILMGEMIFLILAGLFPRL